MFKRDWTTCLNDANYSKLSSQHVREDLFDHIMNTRIFTQKAMVYLIPRGRATYDVWEGFKMQRWNMWAIIWAWTKTIA